MIYCLVNGEISFMRDSLVPMYMNTRGENIVAEKTFSCTIGLRHGKCFGSTSLVERRMAQFTNGDRPSGFVLSHFVSIGRKLHLQYQPAAKQQVMHVCNNQVPG